MTASSYVNLSLAETAFSEDLLRDKYSHLEDRLKFESQ
jgi:hypothetical protein